MMQEPTPQTGPPNAARRGQAEKPGSGRAGLSPEEQERRLASAEAQAQALIDELEHIRAKVRVWRRRYG